MALPVAGLGADFVLRATVSPEIAQPGETVVYSISVSSSGGQAPEVPPPEPDPADGLGEPKFAGTQTQTSIINGVVSHSVEYRYAFTPTKEGRFTIPPTGFTLGGRKYESNPVTLTVRKPDLSGLVPGELQGLVVPPRVEGSPDLSRALTGVLFVLPTIKETKIYQGQQVRVAFHLCIDVAGLKRAGLDLRSLQVANFSVPKMSQFLKDEVFPVPQRLTTQERNIGGKVFTVAPLYEVVITPTKSGRLTVDPFLMELLLPVPGRRDPFLDDPFFRDFGGLSVFSRLNAARAVVASPPVDIEVQPLPEEGKPADFSGAVGEFTVRVTPDRSTARAEDDIVKLQVRVEGTGDASVIAAPALPGISGAELLEDPKSAVTRWTDKEKRLSAKTFDYLLRPLTPGTLEIPPVTVSFFNPIRKQYESVKSAPVRIEITPGSHPTTPVAVSATAPRRDDAETTDGTRTAGDDIRYIHAGDMTVIRRGVLTGEGPAFVFLLSVPPLLLFAGWLAGRLRAARDSRSDHFRARDAALHARRQL
ncbi:MAG: BatD family protein, partial [Candidatus Sumerlaeaceae bacterium]|nr:BatD family protein [Candidatus Sumerlaeaceae bacterium]